jgi:ABC-type branched-subunit amino acid transport system substrate-binding protein
LLRGECEAAAQAAERREVPLIALTAREEVSAARRFVFRVRTRAEEEVQTLVNHAMGNLGAQRFAILYPRDAYGLGLRKLFWEAVEQRGGQIVGVAGYDPGATDFAKPIRRLVGYELLTSAEKDVLKTREEMERRARRLPPEEASELRVEARELLGPGDVLLPPQVDYDALFIPESHDKVVLIAPQLAFHEADGSILLGPNGWHHADLVKIAREHVEGAHYTVHFHGESQASPVRDFSGRFHSAYAHAPDVLAAQAFDAANLVLMQLARGRESRDELREGVLDVTSYPGVTGTLTMGADGNARKRPFLLRVERGKVLAVD